jgi:spore maturation protein CgeB
MAARLAAVERWQDRVVARRLSSLRPDLVIVTGRGLQPAVIGELKRALAVPIVFWFSDALSNMDRQYPLASAYDAWFYKDPYIVDIVRKKLRLDAYYLPEACHPKWHRRVSLSAEDRARYGCEITTAGNMYYYRARLLEQFVDRDLKIWGASFPEWLDSPLRANYPNVYVAELEKSKAYAAAKIVLNTMHYAEIWGVNLRTFEIAGCGGFQIADMRPRLPELFEPDREIVTFETADELKDKVDYYLDRPEQRQAIADAGYARAHAEHTYRHRLLRLLRVLEGQRRGHVDEPVLSLSAERPVYA